MTLPSRSESMTPLPRLKAATYLLSDQRIGGYVLDPANLATRFVVELYADGCPASIARACLYDHELAQEGFADGCYGFLFTIDATVLSGCRLVEVRLANLNQVLGAPILISASPTLSRNDNSRALWIGGLRITGQLEGSPNKGVRKVKAFVDGVLVSEALASQWANSSRGRDAVAVRAFDLTLPSHFADGKIRRAQIVDDAGNELPGSPCTFIAFKDGLSQFIENCAQIESEKLRGELFDKLVPQSMPFTTFVEWQRAFPMARASLDHRIKIAVALVGENEFETSVESLQAQTDCAWVAGVLCDGDGQMAFGNESLKQFLASEAKACECAVFALSGTVFHPHALALLANALSTFPDSALVYSDIAIKSEDGKDWPIAFPAFDYERMLEQGFGAFLFATSLSRAQEFADSGVNDLFRLFNSLVDGLNATERSRRSAQGTGFPIHLPGFLARIPKLDLSDGSFRLAKATAAHLKTNGSSAAVKPAFGALLPAARLSRNCRQQKVSILIPTRDRLDLLEPCLDSIRQTTNVEQTEVIVIDNDSSDPLTKAFFAEVKNKRVRIVHFGGTFNFARLINAGVSIATADYVLLLNNDVEALEAGWLDEMMNRISEPDVGAVGPTLLWPSRVVQHAGIVLGVNFAAAHAFNERIEGDPGYADLLNVSHECSAVTGACLLTRRKLLIDCGGLDSVHFPVNFNDVDFCLKLRAKGLRIIVTPHAKLLHRESESRGRDLSLDGSNRMDWEHRNLRSAWGEALMNDPYYSPMLALDGAPFSALAWPPRSSGPRQPIGIVARPIPPGY